MGIAIDGRAIGHDEPTYFIADIAANHDGSLERACRLIRLAAEAGADAAKFQHFTAERIVSDVGFERLGSKVSHQAAWTKPVTEVYADASVPWDWTEQLVDECKRDGIAFLSTPYDLDVIDALDPYVPAFKIGSGDIDWLESIDHVARKGKPVLLATGAASLGDVVAALQTVLAVNPAVVLMQCNTNYTASDENFDHLHLNVLRSFAAMFPHVVLGLSDHTHGPAAVLGAVALGARVIERHFTDDNGRTGPDHKFALDPVAWRSMVDETRRLERALGSPLKHVTANEVETAVVQRRCVRAARDLQEGELLSRADIEVLRPATPGAIRPNEIDLVVGCRMAQPVIAGSELRWTHLSE